MKHTLMQCILIFICIIFIAFSAYANTDREEYQLAKDNYKEAQHKQDFDLIVSTLQKYIDCAKKLNKYKTLAWQYNNMANWYIEEFINRTENSISQSNQRIVS